MRYRISHISVDDYSHLYEADVRHDAVVEVLCGAFVSVQNAVVAAKEHYVDALTDMPDVCEGCELAIKAIRDQRDL